MGGGFEPRVDGGAPREKSEKRRKKGEGRQNHGRQNVFLVEWGGFGLGVEFEIDLGEGDFFGAGEFADEPGFTDLPGSVEEEGFAVFAMELGLEMVPPRV
jgi:hypothetical protein